MSKRIEEEMTTSVVGSVEEEAAVIINKIRIGLVAASMSG